MKNRRHILLWAAAIVCSLTFHGLSSRAEIGLSWTKVSGPWSPDNEGGFGCIAVHPTNPNIMFLGASVLGPGVFKTSDGGATWVEKNTGIQALGIFTRRFPPVSKIVFSPSNPNTIYLGTAVDDPLQAGGAGNIYKSTDAGETWQMASGTKNWLSVYQVNGSVFDLDVSPQNSDTVYGGVTGQGVLKTSNGGASWTTVYAAGVSEGAVDYFTVVKVVKSQPNTILFSGFTSYSVDVIPLPNFETTGAPGVLPLGIFKSADAGMTWTRATIADPYLFRYPLTTDIQAEPASGILYASSIAYQTPVYYPVGNKGIFRSGDVGNNWNSVNDPEFGNLSSFPVVALAATQGSTQQGIFAATGFGGRILSSKDGGNHWSVLTGLPLHTFVGKLGVAGNSLFALTSDGVYFADVSTFLGTVVPSISAFSPASLRGLPLPQVQRVTIIGKGFLPTSTLTFFDGSTTYSGRTPTYIGPNELKYDIAVGDRLANWTVKVVNGTTESARFPFTVSVTADTTAPAAPMSLDVVSGTWSRNNLFYVDWVNPSDASGIVKVWWKLGSPPTSASDGASCGLPIYKPLPIYLYQSEGTQPLYVWLEDGAGNRNHNNRASCTLRLDSTQPTMSLTGHRSGGVGTMAKGMSTTASDAAGAKEIFSKTAQGITTEDTSIILDGQFTDNLSGVTRVIWVNYLEGSGTAGIAGSSTSGSWTAGPIPLFVGTNAIRVTGFDTAGNQASTTIAVVRLNTSNSGSVSITLGPQDAINAGAQWRVNSGSWRNSGDTETGIPAGARLVEFKPVNGYNTPAIIVLNVAAGQTTSASAIYTRVQVNQPPYVPSSPTPANGTMNVSRSGLVVSWTGGDPDGPVEYLVKFGPTPDPEVRAGFGAVSGNSWPVDMPLEAGTTYYWGIRAKDSEGLITDGPIWSFTTAYDYSDLVPKGLNVDGNVRPGAQVAISVVVSNAGTYVSPGAYVRFYLSRSPGAKELQLTPNVPDIVPNLNPGQQQAVTFTATLKGLQAGTSYIDAWIDSGSPGPFSENNLANNVQSVPVNYVDGQNPEFTCAYLNIYAGGYGRTGEKRTITYCVGDDVGIATCDFYWSTDAGATWMVIQEGVVPNRPPQNGATFEWTIPADFQLTTNLWIKIIARDTSGNWAERLAGPYTVKDGTKPVVTVLSPNGGELWDTGTAHDVRWSVSAPNGIAMMELWFYAEGHADWIADIRSNTNGVFSWTLPTYLTTTTGRVKVWVSDFNYNEAEDFSDGYFTIRDTSTPPPPPWATTKVLTSLPAGDPGNNDSPRIAADGAGNLHMAYFYSFQTNAAPQVRHQTIYYTKRTGTNWSTPTAIYSAHQELTGDERHFGYQLDNLRIGVDSQQRPHVLWQTRYDNLSQYNRKDVFYAGYDGTTWSSPFNLSDDLRGPFSVNNLTWTNRANIPRPAENAACCALNGKIYVLGAGTRTSFYEFDPSANTWAPKADIPADGISEGGAVAINGKIYAVGNPFDGRVKIYNPGTGSWTEGAAILTRRSYPCVVELNGKMYVIGGLDPSGNTKSSKNEIYDPANNTWATMADMLAPRGYAAGAAVGGKIYIIGGELSNNSASSLIEVYDPQSNTWSTMVKPVAATWPRPRRAAVCATGGRIYVMGGRDPEYDEVSKGVFEYDPATNSWQQMQPLQAVKRDACSAVIGNKIYVAGGVVRTNGWDTILDTLEEATIASTLTGMPSQDPDIAVDAADKIHVAWRDGGYWQPDTNSNTGFKFSGTVNVHYRTKAPGGGWNTVTRLTDTGADNPVLASDVFTNTHLVFRASMTNLAYLMWNGSSWSSRTLPIDCSDCSDYTFDLAADPEAHLHLGLYCWNDYGQSAQILYRFYNGTNWSPGESIGSNYVTSPLVAADSLGRPHVLWLDTTTGNRLIYRTESAMGWETPIQLNLASQSADLNMGDLALSRRDDQVHVVWSALVNGNDQILYNHAYVGATNDVYPPSVSVTAPDTGRVLPIGSVYTVRWSAADNRGVASVDLHYSWDGGTNWTTIATNEVDDGMYDWTVQSVGTNVAVIRVTARDGAGNVGVGYSGRFTTSDFTPPTGTIVAPTNGATLVGNSIVTVNWNATDNVAVTWIDLDYSLNNSGAWFEMASGLPNSGAYAWTVPNIGTEAMLIRVIAGDAAGYAASAVSQPLRIVPANNPPFPPNSPFPLHGGSNLLPTSVRLQWSCDDLDGDPLTYQVCLGTNGSPAFAAATTEAQFAPGFLLPGTTYHWQVIASDGKATNAGPVWDFTTANGAEPRCVLSGMQFGTNGHFRLLLDGVFGKAYTLQASTDLLTWTNLMSITPTSSSIPLDDTNAPNYPWRFYRAVTE